MNAAILFDIDGTLVDSTYHHAVAWHRAFTQVARVAQVAPGRQGMDVPPLWRLHRAIGMGGDRLVGEVAGERAERDHGDDLRATWRTEYLDLHAEVRPLPGAADLVHRLAADGLTVALASSGDPQFAREAVDLLGIARDVTALLTSDDVDSSKPAPDLIQQTLGRLGDVERALFVGDTVYDVESASRAGIGCLALRSGGFGRAELEEAGALRVDDLPADLIGLDWARALSTDDARSGTAPA
ncbi:MAG: HAD family hydrolase [Nocardioides sp.]|uniref:HAD family hydrolase n=1 Tax=Nocardioides sp. TaxID=35761 RepID=UPI0039E5F6EC